MVEAVRNVRAVLADRVLDDATVVWEDDTIVSVHPGAPWPTGALDGRGAYCLPGLVDSHSDGLEKELQPRPGVSFPEAFALRSFEGRVRAAGVTTVFHGVAFEENESYGRTIALADSLRDTIADRQREGGALVDHRALYRLDARDGRGFDALVRRLATDDNQGHPPLVSFEDHTPGQGQFADTVAFREHLGRSRGLSPEDADRQIAELIAERDELLHQRARALPWLTACAREGRIRLLAHDPTTVADVEEVSSWGASVAEFPTSVEAATAARDRGMPTVLGSPNVLRGGSHSGNVAAEELVRRGLCTSLASDYLPSTLLAAAFLLARRGATNLPAAIALVTSGAAEAVGLSDRGRLAEGQRADVVLVDGDAAWPTVRAVVRAADRRHLAGAPIA